MKKLFSILLSVAILLTMASVTLVQADNGWHVMFNWENEGPDTSAVSSTAVLFGDNKVVYVKELSAYNDKSYSLLQGSKKAIWIYNDKNFDPKAECTPLNNKAPAKIALRKLTGATDLRVNLHIKQKSYSPENFYFGAVIDGVTYYQKLTKSEYYSAKYYSFVGKTLTKFGSSETLVVKASDIPKITALAGWVSTSGWSALLIDDVEYYGNEIDFTGDDPTSVFGKVDFNINISNKPQYVSNRTITNEPNKEDITMILVIGQSNSTTGVGYACELKAIANNHRSEVTEVTTTPKPNTVYMAKYGETISELNSSNDLSNLIPKDKIGGYSSALGTRWNELTGQKVVIVQAAVGSSGIHEWVKDPQNYTCTCGHYNKHYPNAVSQFSTCYDALKDKYNIKNSFYIWNQGEHDDNYSPKAGVDINSKEKYYEAYKSMHEDLLKDLPLDFGAINMGRSHYGSNSMYLSVSRLGQYEAVNNLPGCYLASRLFENTTKEDMDQTTEGSSGIHATQKTYNAWGKDAAEVIYNSLFADNDGIETIEVLKNNNKTGEIKAQFNTNGKVVLGGNVVLKNEEIAVVPVPMGNYKVTFSVDGDESKVDAFGTPDSSIFDAEKQVKMSVSFAQDVKKVYVEEPTTEPTTEPSTSPTTLAPTQPTTTVPVVPAKLKLSKPTIKVTAGKNKLTVKITKVKNAKKYAISYKLKSAKKWKTITIKANGKKYITKVIKKLKKGKKYQVKVVAINGSVKSKSSKIITVKVK